MWAHTLVILLFLGNNSTPNTKFIRALATIDGERYWKKAVEAGFGCVTSGSGYIL